MPSTPPPEGAVRVLIADDHRLFAESVRAALSEDERIDVIGIAYNGHEAVELALELRPDVILMDLKMPLLDGFEATRMLREARSETQVLILTGTDAIGADDAALAGASGYVRKEQSIADLKRVFLEVASLAAVLGHSSR